MGNVIFGAFFFELLVLHRIAAKSLLRRLVDEHDLETSIAQIIEGKGLYVLAAALKLYSR